MLFPLLSSIFLELHFTWDVKLLNVWTFDKNLKFYINVGLLFTENYSYLYRYINVIYISISYFPEMSISTEINIGITLGNFHYPYKAMCSSTIFNFWHRHNCKCDL